MLKKQSYMTMLI